MSRAAVRVLVIDGSDHLLLVRFHDGERTWWCPPGGGIEAGESDEDAGRRELHEEVGLRELTLGPCVWTRHHIGVFRGEPFDQRERFYVAHVPRFDPSPTRASDGALEHPIEDIRWWSPEDLAASAETFAPRRLVSAVASLLADGPPGRPIDVGV